MNTQGLTNCYRVHLTRIDGAPIDTPTGTLTFSHSYRTISGRIFTPQEVAAKWSRRCGAFNHYKAYKVERVEVFQFDPMA
tara:strand:- start:161 stop:400 length:240 start_codon:yes stop_codon:yes gene_type:complete